MSLFLNFIFQKNVLFLNLKKKIKLILHLHTCFYRWLIRCSPKYSIKLIVTYFQLEKNSDEILLYDATLGGNNLVGEINSLGEIETSSSELLISFKSDCDITNKGFQAFVEINKKSTDNNDDLKAKVNQNKTENTYDKLITSRDNNIFSLHNITSFKKTTYPQTSTSSYSHTVEDLDKTKTESFTILETTSFKTTQKDNVKEIQLGGN